MDDLLLTKYYGVIRLQSNHSGLHFFMSKKPYQERAIVNKIIIQTTKQTSSHVNDSWILAQYLQGEKNPRYTRMKKTTNTFGRRQKQEINKK